MTENEYQRARPTTRRAACVKADECSQCGDCPSGFGAQRHLEEDTSGEARPHAEPPASRQKSLKMTRMRKRFVAQRPKKRPSCRAGQEGQVTSMETTKQQA